MNTEILLLPTRFLPRFKFAPSAIRELPTRDETASPTPSSPGVQRATSSYWLECFAGWAAMAAPLLYLLLDS